MIPYSNSAVVEAAFGDQPQGLHRAFGGDLAAEEVDGRLCDGFRALGHGLEHLHSRVDGELHSAGRGEVL